MDYDCIYKVLIIGDFGVGKTSLSRRYADQEENLIEGNAADLGVDFRVKTLNLAGKVVKLQMWDTAGQERFRSITRSYYNNADGIIIVYDITNEASFLAVHQWIEDIKDLAPKNAIKVLVGNKSDLDAQRTVSTLRGIVTAYNLGVSFIETSAENGSNVELAFMTTVTEMHERNIPPRPAADNNPKIKINESNAPQGGWSCW